MECPHLDCLGCVRASVCAFVPTPVIFFAPHEENRTK